MVWPVTAAKQLHMFNVSGKAGQLIRGACKPCACHLARMTGATWEPSMVASTLPSPSVSDDGRLAPCMAHDFTSYPSAEIAGPQPVVCERGMPRQMTTEDTQHTSILKLSI